jgi:hypothetical protein
MGLLVLIGFLIALWAITWPFRKYSRYQEEKEKERQERKEKRKREQKREFGLNVEEDKYPVFIEAKSSPNDRKIREAWPGEWQPKVGQQEEKLFRALKNTFEEEKLHHGDIRFFPGGKHGRDHARGEEKRRSYYPDISYYDESEGLAIDIEVDEPYYVENGERKPTHWVMESTVGDGLLSDDQKRNEKFIEAGWHVIRFAESQVAEYPDKCAGYVEKVIGFINGNQGASRGNGWLPPKDRWTIEDAKQKDR